jgi:hypothetical protein
MTDDKDAIEALVRESAATAFDAGFSDRVAARLRATAEASLSDALERQVRRVVPLVAAASLMLAAYNWWGGRESASSTLEAALNLPRVSLSSAYSTSTLVDATNFPLGTP